MELESADMDLLYVGNFTRFYAGDWDPAAPPEAGADEATLEEVREGALEWQDWANQEVDLLEEPLSWSEEPGDPCFVGRPTSRGVGALQLWAAYAEHPGLPVPKRLPKDWMEDPALKASLADGFPSRYPQLLFGVDIWLPVRAGEIFDGYHPVEEDEESRYGSLPALVEELQDLNVRTWCASEETLARWRQQGPDPEGSLEGMARHAYALFVDLARKAGQAGFPMLLH